VHWSDFHLGSLGSVVMSFQADFYRGWVRYKHSFGNLNQWRVLAGTGQDTSLDENKEQTSSRPGSTTLVAKNLRKKVKNIPPYPDKEPVGNKQTSLILIS